MLAETLPATGSFDCAAVASGRRFDASEFIARNAPLAGLQQEAGYIWGTMRDDDETRYSVMRRIAPTPAAANSDGRKSLGGRLMVLSAESGADGMELRREPRGAVDSADIAGTLIGENTACFASSPDAAGRPMRLVLGEDDFDYREDGVIDVTGRLAVPPLQWYLPGPNASLLYTTQTWLVDGALTGKHVRGFLFWEQAWMLPGGRLYVEKDPLHDAQYLTWYSWANHWPDGSCEVGHFLFGSTTFTSASPRTATEPSARRARWTPASRVPPTGTGMRASPTISTVCRRCARFPRKGECAASARCRIRSRRGEFIG